LGRAKYRAWSREYTRTHNMGAETDSEEDTDSAGTDGSDVDSDFCEVSGVMDADGNPEEGDVPGSSDECDPGLN